MLHIETADLYESLTFYTDWDDALTINWYN